MLWSIKRLNLTITSRVFYQPFKVSHLSSRNVLYGWWWVRVKNFLPGSGQFLVSRFSHLWFEFGFGKISLKMSNFSIFSLQVKKNLLGSGQKVPRSRAGQPLIYCGSKVCSGQGPSLLDSTFFVVFFPIVFDWLILKVLKVFFHYL